MAVSRGAELPINPNVEKWGVGLSWDRGGNAVDVDLQAVIVDTKGAIIDAVYYNNMKALKCVTHSGDEQTGDRSGIDETIWLSLKRIPEHVKLVIFVVAAYSRGHLRDAKNGKIHILEETKDNEVACYQLEQSEKEVDAVAMLLRASTGDWNLHIIDEPARDGRHFIDILEPTLGNLIRQTIPGAPKRQKVAFAMDKGDVVDLPESSAVKSISAGLGWDVVGEGVDLDVSAVLFSKDGREIGAVFFGNEEEFGIKHSGDNLTGEGSGDDEVIQVNLEALPDQVEQLIFCVNIYTKGVTFEKVSKAYCRVCNQEGDELARYELLEAKGEQALLIARLFREPGTRWGFQALGTFCRGQTWKDSVKYMQPIVNKTARELQMMRASTVSLAPPQTGSVGSTAPPPPEVRRSVVSTAPPPPEKKDCLLQ